MNAKNPYTKICGIGKTETDNHYAEHAWNTCYDCKCKSKNDLHKKHAIHAMESQISFASMIKEKIKTETDKTITQYCEDIITQLTNKMQILKNSEK